MGQSGSEWARVAQSWLECVRLALSSWEWLSGLAWLSGLKWVRVAGSRCSGLKWVGVALSGSELVGVCQSS